MPAQSSLGALPAVKRECCRSSVVERILGKAEVVSSILTGSTILPPPRKGPEMGSFLAPTQNLIGIVSPAC